jgi:hypothetical protein
MCVVVREIIYVLSACIQKKRFFQYVDFFHRYYSLMSGHFASSLSANACTRTVEDVRSVTVKILKIEDIQIISVAKILNNQIG